MASVARRGRSAIPAILLLLGASVVNAQPVLLSDPVAAPASATIKSSVREFGPKKKSGASVALEAPTATQRTWKIRSGDYLQNVLEEWTSGTGWHPVWDIEEVSSLRLMADAEYRADSLKDAVKQLSESLSASGEKIIFSFHNGNRLLRVSRTN